ncbi:glycosyltransferase family 2 protein [Bowmanella denitrificans]|uniref:glycosyltransferase family 2 protein n=1 Tax=Bowmanella denitrificans TaxID=366582 RepID=UPI000C9BE258|nr:glycosyltransferase family 2 protein [Bowmanella denitrificans]
MKTLAILICCFNRKAKTLACLASLQAQQLPVGLQLDIYLLDDGSTDGTSSAVQEQYPWVKLHQGSGNLYWNGAMRYVWQQASQQDYDAYLWLNDDVQLYPDALQRLWQAFVELPECPGALVGSMLEPDADKVSYGGRRSLRAWHPLGFGALLQPQAQSQQCDFINGNLCLIPRQAFAAIGLLDKAFTHALGDFDYGLRLKKAGLALYVAPGYFGRCASNSKLNSVFDASLPLSTRLTLLNHPGKFVPVDEWMLFVRRHGGAIWPLLWLKVLVRKLFPRLWLWWRGKKPADLRGGKVGSR